MKKRYFILPALLTLLTGSLYALKRDEVTFTRNFSLDHIDISIISDENLNNVVPFTDYNYHVQIENQGEPCYVRILDDSENILIDTDWIKIGDYYYYPEIIDCKELIDYTSHITIGELNEEQVELKWQIQAEAIQAKNFTLDLSLDDPFKQQEIISFEKEGEKS